jgi:hypothetical protein
MKQFRCKNHDIIVQIPTHNDEFLCGRYHQNIEDCYNHHERFHNCIFEEVQE